MSNQASNKPAGINNYEFYVNTPGGAFFIVADYLDPDLSQGAKLYVLDPNPDASRKADLVAWFKNAYEVIRNPIAVDTDSKETDLEVLEKTLNNVVKQTQQRIKNIFENLNMLD